MRATAIVLLTCVTMPACVAHGPYSHMVFPVDSKELEVAHTKPKLHDGKIEIQWLEIHALGDARIEEATLSIFSDRDANGTAEDSERVHTTTGRPNGVGRINMEYLTYPDLPRLTASVRVRVSGSDPVERTWLLVAE